MKFDGLADQVADASERGERGKPIETPFATMLIAARARRELRPNEDEGYFSRWNSGLRGCLKSQFTNDEVGG